MSHTALSAMCGMWQIATYHTLQAEQSDGSEILCAVFSDFEKAFDLVDHTILRQKLQTHLNNPSVMPFFQSYLSEGHSM